MENKQICEPTLDSVLRKIERSDDDEIGAVISALIRRYRIVYPEWELLLFTIPAGTSGKRGQAIEDIITFLKKYYP